MHSHSCYTQLVLRIGYSSTVFCRRRIAHAITYGWHNRPYCWWHNDIAIILRYWTSLSTQEQQGVNEAIDVKCSVAMPTNSTSPHAKYPDWGCWDYVCKVGKNIGNTRSKGVNKNYTPVHCVSWNPIFMQDFRCDPEEEFVKISHQNLNFCGELHSDVSRCSRMKVKIWYGNTLSNPLYTQYYCMYCVIYMKKSRQLYD